MAAAIAESVRGERPAHIPENLVVDFDYIRDEGIVADPHRRMADIAETMPPLFWTPRYGGHWVVNCRGGYRAGALFQ